MASILFIDDDQDVGKFTESSLKEVGHSVDWVRADYWEDSLDKVERLNEKKWNLLILDLSYPTDQWGGMWLFNRMARKGFRPLWESREIVYSKHFTDGPGLESATSGHLFGLRVFLDSTGIPFDCAFNNRSFDRATLIEKIELILKR